MRAEKWLAAQVGAEGARIFTEGPFNCAETVILSLVKGGYIESDCVPAAATPFGAGLGRKGDLCGILTGGTIAIGLYCGRREAGDLESKEKAYSIARRFYEWFERDNEGVRCWDLTGCDFSTPEGLDRYHETGIRQQCTERLRRAVEALVEMLG